MNSAPFTHRRHVARGMRPAHVPQRPRAALRRSGGGMLSSTHQPPPVFQSMIESAAKSANMAESVRMGSQLHSSTCEIKTQGTSR